MCIRRGRSRRSWRIISAVSSAATRAGGNKEQEEKYAGEIKAAPNITKASSSTRSRWLSEACRRSGSTA